MRGKHILFSFFTSWLVLQSLLFSLLNIKEVGEWKCPSLRCCNNLTWPFPDQKSQKRRLRTNQLHESKGKNLKLRAMSICRELTGQTILVVTRISLLLKTFQPNQSNPKYYARRRWFFSKNSWEKPISFSKWQLHPWSGRSVLTNGKRPEIRSFRENKL